MVRKLPMKLLSNRYGKARVRVLKILRAGARHTVQEIEVTALLQGDFGESYTAGDNTGVVPTDTIKNTINVLAKDHLGEEIERFALSLGNHFLERYKQVASANIEISAKRWERMEIEGEPHPHAFAAGSEARGWTRAVSTRESQLVESGVRDLVIMKSTGSGWAGFPRCEYTTLPETTDRILATSFDATWTWSNLPADFRRANDAILAAMLKAFANNYSPSAQASVYQMGEAALSVCPEIARVAMKMPNKHYLLVNLKPFGMENQNEIFVPTDDPFGLIEGTVVRDA